MVTYNDVDYFYVYNLQGDVVALIDANGTQVVEYGYDARGNPISKTGSLAATIGPLNRSAIAGMCTMRRRDCIICGAGIIIRCGKDLSILISILELLGESTLIILTPIVLTVHAL